MRGIAQLENESTEELRGAPAPRGQLTLKRNKLGRAEEAHDQLPNSPRKRTPPSQPSLTLASVRGVSKEEERERKKKKEKKKKEEERSQETTVWGTISWKELLGKGRSILPTAFLSS